ncbi:MAG: AAA family ATPase [Muribaculum sp.]|nr:AAA family ATPase [Muribaculum sp.]
MKEIIIKEMRLINFKGVRELTVTFNQSVTNIFGRNGSGKTTVFDAFAWLLFGKDSSDRKEFDLKTLDADGNIIPQLPHEVSAIITVNGQEIRLKRCFTEKWVKRAGKIDKEFNGNKEERFFNDVPCTKSEYEAHIAEICSENIFKFITSPTAFTSQKAEAQKTMLHRMAGNITDAEVAAGNSDFEQLLETITGKTLVEYKKEIGAKKQRINAELIDKPGRIDEKKRDLAQAQSEDWSSLEEELKQKTEARAQIEKQLDDISEAARATDSARSAIATEISSLRDSQFKRRSSIEADVMCDYYAVQQKRTELEQRIRTIKFQIQAQQKTVEDNQREVEDCDGNRERLIAQWRELSARQKQISEEQLQFNEEEFVCPTCHRPLEVADIEAKEAQMLQNFEEERKKRLARVAESIARNKESGLRNNERKSIYQKRIEDAQLCIEELKKQIADIEASADYNVTLQKPDASVAIAEDTELKNIEQQIAEAQKRYDAAAVKTEDTSELKTGRAMLTAAIEELITKLASRKNVKDIQQRIEELESEMQSLNIELAELERQEYIIAEFSKARSAAIEQRINGLFKYVRFRWLKVAINGAESETCEATINGVPYASLNHAGQITAGLDIINAICKSEDICAPIFIDNAESINDIISMKSQIVNLIVSRDEKLRVEA